MSDVRTELIQVAAVAIAIVENMDGDVDRAFVDVAEERQRQDRIWGPQNHPIEKWLAILGEEVGEAFKAANDQIIFKKQPQQPLPDDPIIPTPTCEHGWTMEHCTKDAEGSCPWNGSKHEIGRGPWADQECYCPGPGNTTGPTDREMAEFALGIIDGALAFGRAILTPEEGEE